MYIQVGSLTKQRICFEMCQLTESSTDCTYDCLDYPRSPGVRYPQKSEGIFPSEEMNESTPTRIFQEVHPKQRLPCTTSYHSIVGVVADPRVCKYLLS